MNWMGWTLLWVIFFGVALTLYRLDQITNLILGMH